MSDNKKCKALTKKGKPCRNNEMVEGFDEKKYIELNPEKLVLQAEFLFEHEADRFRGCSPNVSQNRFVTIWK